MIGILPTVKLNIVKLFVGTLILIAILLSLLALQLTVQLAASSQTNDKVVQVPTPLRQEIVAKELKVTSETNDKVVQEPSQEIVSKELKATVQITETDFLDTSGKYEKDRVYCMIPFIWNPKIYDASE